MLLVITGASRGLGRAIALEFCRGNNDNSLDTLDVILISRNEQLLRQTRFELQQANANNSNVRLCVLDLGDLKDLEARVEAQIINEMNELQQKKQYHHFVFINNAGSIGHIGPAIQTPSLTQMQQNIDLNVTSACWLSARMAKWADELQHTRTTIVNISSLLAIQAFPSLALYSAGKAARDQYHVAMAKELSQSTATATSTSTSSIPIRSRIRILNYAPGPLETDMTNEIRQAHDLDTQLKPQYQKKLIEPRDSAARLVKLVMDGSSFESGQHIDYYDLNG